MTGQELVSAANVAVLGNVPLGMVMSKLSDVPFLMPAQSILTADDSCEKVLVVSYGGFPVGAQLLPLICMSAFPLYSGTESPATFPPPHWSVPLIVPVPFLMMPVRLVQALRTFMVVLFHEAKTPTVRVACAVRPLPPPTKACWSYPVEVMKYVPLPFGMSSQMGVARTMA